MELNQATIRRNQKGGQRDSRLDETLTPRVKNRASERTLGFVNDEGFWLNAVALIGEDGRRVDLTVNGDKLDLIYDELVKLNLHLTILTGNNL